MQKMTLNSHKLKCVPQGGKKDKQTHQIELSVESMVMMIMMKMGEVRKVGKNFFLLSNKKSILDFPAEKSSSDINLNLEPSWEKNFRKSLRKSS